MGKLREIKIIRVTQSPILRPVLLFSGLFAAGIILLAGFILWQTMVVETARIDQLLMRDAQILANDPDNLAHFVENQVTPDLRPLAYMGLFARDGRVVAGNLAVLPQKLPQDGVSHRLVLAGQSLRAVARLIGSDRILLLGRPVDSMLSLQKVVMRALAGSLIPALALSLAGNWLLGRRGAAPEQVKDDSPIRTDPIRETNLKVGDLEIDLLDRKVRRGARDIDLLPREFKLLDYMMRRPDEVLSRQKLLEEVWNYRSTIETNLVDVHVGKLRRKIDVAPEEPMIKLVRGVGFVLSANPKSDHAPTTPKICAKGLS